MVVAGVDDQGEQAAEHGLVGAVVPRVDGVFIGLHNVAEQVDALDVVDDGDARSLLLLRKSYGLDFLFPMFGIVSFPVNLLTL